MKTIANLRHQARRGFTLLEIMLVVAIIALLLGAGLAYLGDVFVIGQETRITADLTSFNQKLKIYEMSNGFLPSSEQGLQALVTLPSSEPRPTRWHQLMEKLPLDPWNRSYVYLQPGVHNPQSYDLYTKGKDGVADTTDDVGNWDKPK